jgi:hypothetical protein
VKKWSFRISAFLTSSEKFMLATKLRKLPRFATELLGIVEIFIGLPTSFNF